MASTSASPVAAPAVDPRREREAVLTASITDAVDSLDAKFGLHGKASLQQGGAVKLQLKGKGKKSAGGEAFLFPRDASAQPASERARVRMLAMRCPCPSPCPSPLRAWARDHATHDMHAQRSPRGSRR
jgi:hypothetical protein